MAKSGTALALAAWLVGVVGCAVPVSRTASAPAPLPQAAGSLYAGTTSLDTPGLTKPLVLENVRPTYTPEAMRHKVSGDVALLVRVNTQGLVDRAEVSKSLDPVYGLDQEALKAVRGWRFTPASLEGRAVAVVVPLELSFTLH
jgi:TonB family protein